MITHTTPNGLTYQIHPSPAETDRRIATLIRHLYPTFLTVHANRTGNPPWLPPASGAERHRTSTIDGGSPIATSQPRSPARP
jgi:hypothetical protein